MAGLLDGLNSEQRRAVEQTEGPVLVLAGAGSGKTRVITCRIAHLVARQVSARNILAMTFTNKAAREMRERVAGLVGAATAKELTVSTFHSFCVRVLREHAEILGLSPKFSICDDSDQLTAVKGALREMRIDEKTVHPRAALSKISLFKSKLVSPAKAFEVAEDDWEELVARTYKSYNEHLKRSRTVDFDDLLLLVGELLEKHPEVRLKYQNRYRYVMVDEYQDTNGPQYEVLKHIAGQHRNLCVVGDDDQSIYGWRGADVKKILNFEKDFPGAAVIRLETNYRSTEQILAAANAVIKNNKSRHEKTLKAACGSGDAIRIFPCEDEEHESEFVVDEIIRDARANRIKFGDIAILFRTATQPRTFESRLRAARIPYDLVGGMSFFDRKEVRDILAYVRLAANPFDEASLLRVVNVPPRGVGKASMDKVVDLATRDGVSAAAVFDRGNPEGVSAETYDSVRKFRQVLADFAAKVPSVGLVTALRELIVAVKYHEEIARCYPDGIDQKARSAAVGEVVNVAENYARRASQPSLEGFLENVTLSTEDSKSDGDEKAHKDQVTLMTLHAAKGLEFPRVYLVGAEEGLIPHQRSVQEDTVEEERRLMYVGITRAKRQLTITRVKTRAKYGRREPCLPSRFLYEIKGETPPFALPTAQPKKEKDEKPFVPPQKRGTNPMSKPAKGRSGARR
ncbi:MAG TPA: UvrD-helicase domain-containing protein [Planctomycetota bacterium]|nr:UvrD-helicase domain-containing protein [Planctomycetota bacterium]